MLRKRSRTVSGSSKPGLMSDPTPTLPSPTVKHSRPITSSIFFSPKLFVPFSSPKASPDSSSEAAMSPTSILETKPFTSFANPFFSERKSITPPPTAATEHKHHPWDNGDSKAIGLGLVDALNNENNDNKPLKPESRMVLFGSQLKIQVPATGSNSISPAGSVESLHTPIEFGIKNRDSQLALFSPARRSPNLGSDVFSACLSPREIELSEDYTCVIAHGPNPRTTHIFDNQIVESCGDWFSRPSKEMRFFADRPGYPYPSDDFLSYCHACKKNLGQGKDIYMYRGEKAFCSKECRYEEMLLDEEGMEKCSSDL